MLARAEADANVKSKLSAQIVSLKAAMEQKDEDLKISQKSMLTDDIATADAERDGLYSGYKKAVNPKSVIRKSFLSFSNDRH